MTCSLFLGLVLLKTLVEYDIYSIYNCNDLYIKVTDGQNNELNLWGKKRLTTDKCSDGIFFLLPLFLRVSDALGLLVTLSFTLCNTVSEVNILSSPSIIPEEI